MESWTDFCNATKYSSRFFFTNATYFPTPDRIKAERERLMDFVAYLIAYPYKKSRTSAERAIYHVEALSRAVEDATGRCPGTTLLAPKSADYSQFLDGLKRLAPKKAYHIEPIMADDLRKIRPTMDLKNNQMHRTLWALWTTMFQSISRSSDLIEPSRPHRQIRHHRYLTRAGVTTQTNKHNRQRTMTIRMGVTKTDQTGTGGHTKILLFDYDANAISAAVAIDDMIRHSTSVT